MSILRNFKPVVKEIPEHRRALYPSSSSSNDLDVEIISAANLAVETVLVGDENESETPKCTWKRKPYKRHDRKLKLQIAKYAMLHGDAAALRKFKKHKVALRTIGDWKKKYVNGVNLGKGEPTKFPLGKRGKPSTLGPRLTKRVTDYIRLLRKHGAVVNKHIVMAAARGIVMQDNRSLLKDYGGTVEITVHLARYWLDKLNFVRRKATRNARKRPEYFKEMKNKFFEVITNTIKDKKMPDEMIINFDQTGLKMIPTAEWTMEDKGSHQIDTIGKDDKRQITALLSISLSGAFLPPQLIYAGKTSRCHPEVEFPDDWNITHSQNHGSNETTMLQFIDEIVCPYMDKKREELNLAADQHGLVIFDVFAAHRTESVLETLAQRNLSVAFVPAGTTGDLQPLDVGVINEFKTEVRDGFTQWYADMVEEQLDTYPDMERIKVDLKTSYIKPKHANWVMRGYDACKNRHDVVKRGFRKSGIQKVVDDARKE